MVRFDTHKLFQHLTGSGMPKKQANAIVDGLKGVELDNIASPQDVQDCKEDLTEMLKGTEIKLIDMIKESEQRLTVLISNYAVSIHKEIGEKHISNIRWMIGLLIAFTALVKGLKLLD